MKQTKRIVALVLCILVAMSTIFALTSCGKCEHSNTDWVVVKEATETEDGTKNLICLDCEEVVSTETIPATGVAEQPTPPATPAGLVRNGTVLTWDAVEGATSYVVKIGEDTHTVTAPTLDLATLDLTAGTTYEISVQAVNADGSSAFCDAVSFGYLTGEFEITYANKTVSWEPVEFATSYEVRVNGGEIVSLGNATTYNVTFTQAGDHVIEVRYTDGGNAEWMTLTVTAYTVTYDSLSLSGGEVYEYLATGDAMTLPTGTYTNTGYDFSGWFSAVDGGNKYQTGDIFTATNDLTVYGGWVAKVFTLNLSVSGMGITNIQDGATESVTYNSSYTLPIPVLETDGADMFLGWYSGQDSLSTRYTDEYGNSVANAKFTATTTVYPVFISDVLSFELKSDDTYVVSAGPNFDKASKITIPVTYQGKAVTSIIENAFDSRKALVSIKIPNSIKLVGSGAFNGNTALTEIIVYEVEGVDPEAANYSSHDGALIRNDMGTKTLEVFPRAKTGSFTTPAGVTTIRSRAFQNASISEVIFSKDVIEIYERAFHGCKSLTTVKFEGGREADVVLMCGDSSAKDSIFYVTPNVTTIALPAMIAEFDYNYVFDQLTKLTSITVEEGGVNYSSIGGMFTNGNQDTILYAPLSVSGDYTIPDGITAIGANAFKGRTGLTSVTVPMFVESIGANAFAGCTNVTAVTFNGNRFRDLSIGSSAFAGCKLSTVTFEGTGTDAMEEGTISIGASAFAPAGQVTLKTVTFGKGVKVSSIGNNAFDGQSKLTKLNFADNVIVSTIGNSAFKGTKITTLNVPASVTNIGSSAFNGCSELTSITFNEGSSGNITFGSSAFANCSKITSIYLPSTVTAFDGTVFNGCKALTTIEVSDNNTNLETLNGVLYTENYTTLIYYPRGLAVDKAAFDALPWGSITTIGAAAFSGHTTLTSFEIKKGVTAIGEGAFKNCSALTTLTYEASTDTGRTLTIGKEAFYNCANLTSAALPAYTTYIGASAFTSAAFTEFTMPTAVTTIGDNAFAYTPIKKIDIPANVTAIGAGAFSNTKLNTVNVAESETLFTFTGTGTTGAFAGCTQLYSIDLKNRATNIGNYTFSGCTNLGFMDETIGSSILGSNVTSIGTGAFKGVTYVKNLTVPASVTSIGNYAFSGMKALKNVTFVEGTNSLTFGTNVFENCSKLVSITFPARTSKIAGVIASGSVGGLLQVSSVPEFFSGCTSLKNVDVTPGANNHYVSVNGVLYAAESGVAKTLVYCPALNEGTLIDGVATIVIPKTVTLVENRALFNLSVIKTVSFEEYTDGEENYGKQLLSLGRGTTAEQKVGSSSYAVLGGTSNSVTTLNLPSHLARIGSYAISKTTDTLTLNINPDARNIAIGQYAFNNARIFEYIFPGVSELAYGSFMNAFSSTAFTANELNTEEFKVELGANSTVAVIPTQAFNGGKFETFVFPASVMETAASSFMGANRLKTVSFAPNSKMKTLGGNTFSTCSALTTIDFSNAKELTTFGVSPFYNCSSIKSFTFPESLVSIGANCFSGCTGLEEVTLGKSFTPDMLYATDTNNYAATIFGNNSSFATSLKSIKVDKDNTSFKSVDGVLYSADGAILYFYPVSRPINGYTIPADVTRIGHYAFYMYKGTTLTLPDGLTFIGDSAFQSAALTSVRIGSNVESIGNSAFRMNAALTSVVFEDNTKMTKIGDMAFTGSSLLSSVTNIPDSVATIGKQTFQGTAITSIILPAALTDISEGLLRYCPITSITVQSDIQTIGAYAFNGCQKLTYISIPSTVSSIGNEAFKNANKLVTVEFEEGAVLSTLGMDVFQNCAKLTNINLPDTLVEVIFSREQSGSTTYVSGLFKGCTSLKEINLSGLTEIPMYTFEGCTSLEKVTVGDNLTTIGARAFYGCTKLTTVEGAANLTEIGADAFQNCYKLTAIDLSGVTEVGKNVKLVTGVSMGTTRYKEINDTGTFKNCESLVTVDLSVAKAVTASAFENCVNIENLTLGEDIKSIGNRAFYNCDKITKVVIPSSVITLGDYAFYDCDNITTASLTMGLEYLGELAFGSCDKLTTNFIPSTVSTLNGNPYAGCPNVGTLVIDADNEYLTRDSYGSVYSEDMKTLHYYAGGATANLNNVTVIAPGAFAGSNVTSVTIPSSVTTIKPYTFFNCKNLTSVTIGTNVTNIGDGAFQGCEKLASVTIPAKATTLGSYVFANCTSLSNVTFAGTNAYTLGTHFFEGCTAMTAVKLPAKLNGTAIPAYTFAGTGIVNAVIPAYITNIETDGVFMNCADLESVTFEAEQLSYKYIGNYMFYNCDSLVEIEIPNGNSANPLANTIGYTFAECDNLVKVILYYKPSTFGSATPNNAGMFMNCKSLKEVILYNISDVIVEDNGSDDSSDNGASEDGGATEDGGASEEGGSGLGTNTGNGSGLGTNTGNGSGLGTNTGNGSSEDSGSEEGGSGLGTNTGNGSGLGTNTGNGSGLGTNTGNGSSEDSGSEEGGSGLGTNTGNGSGLGTNTGNGSSEDSGSEEGGSGLGTNTGNGSGLGTNTGNGSGLGTNTGFNKANGISYLNPAIISSYAAFNSNVTTFGLGLSTSGGTAGGAGDSEDGGNASEDGGSEESGSGLGTNTGSGLGTNTGSGLGTNTGSGLGTNTGNGSSEDGDSEEGGSGLGTNTGSGLGTNTGSGLGTNTGNGSGLGTNTGNGSSEDSGSEEGGSGLGTNTGNGSGLGTNTGNGSSEDGGNTDSEEGGNTSGGSDDEGETTTESTKYNEGYLGYIGDSWFAGCESLEEITIMNNAYIGDNAFEGCTSLKEVNFYDPDANTDDNNGGSENNGSSEDGGNTDSEEGGSGLGTNTGNGSGLGTNTGNGSGLGTNTGNGSGLGTNTGNGSSEDSGSEEGGSGLGTNTGSGLGTNTGSGLGTNTGSGLGTNTGNGSGLGTNTGNGSSEDGGSEEGGSGLGTNTGSGLGTNTGSGLGTNTGSGLGTNTGSGLGTNNGGATEDSGSEEGGSGLGTNTGSGLGTNTGSGLGTNTGSGLGTNTGSGLGTNTGGGFGTPDSEEGGNTGGGFGTPDSEEGGNTGGGFGTPDSGDDSEEEDVPTTPAVPVTSLKHLGKNAFKGCTALTSIDLPGIPADAGEGVFEGWTAEQTINLSNTEAELADAIANGLFEGCEATINYKAEA